MALPANGKSLLVRLLVLILLQEVTNKSEGIEMMLFT